MRFRDQTIDYAQRYQQAVLGMIRELLEGVAEEGLPGEHHFYLTFDTNAAGVELSDVLQEHYPELMTVVLQNQFWGLHVDDEGFSVTLRFGGIREALVVPWAALVGFADPSVEFAMELVPAAAEGMVEQESPPDTSDSSISEDSEPSEDSAEAEVVSFEEFKRR